mmetsp:Transcript_8514/g.12974  ORF Transcript_8514/g.12974 Transcript_8514/m.12974 type:complete len:411 (+) Transcript_8514:56-1288(+)
MIPTVYRFCRIGAQLPTQISLTARSRSFLSQTTTSTNFSSVSSSSSSTQSNRTSSSHLFTLLFAASAGTLAWYKYNHDNDHRVAFASQFHGRGEGVQNLKQVFDHYASLSDAHGNAYMSMEDFFNSLLRPGHLPLNDQQLTKCWEMADRNHDGRVSFAEYVVWATFLSSSDGKLKTAFMLVDADGNGKLNKKEFTAVFKVLSREMSVAPPDAWLDQFFPDDQTELDYNQFLNTLRSLHDEVKRQEFLHLLKSPSDTFAPADAVADEALAHYKVPDYVINAIKHKLGDGPNHTFSEKRFFKLVCLLEKLDKIEEILKMATTSGLALNKVDFNHWYQTTFPDSKMLDAQELDIIFDIFDADGNGVIDRAEYELAHRPSKVANVRHRLFHASPTTYSSAYSQHRKAIHEAMDS